MKTAIVEGIPHIHPQDMHELTSDVELIDVRTPEEYEGELGHVDGSKLLSLGPELESYLASCPKDKKILFICRSGNRSGQVTRYAQEDLKMENTYNMTGGMLLWKELGFPVSKTSGNKPD